MKEDKEMTIDDFFHNNPQPIQSSKQFKESLSFKLSVLGCNDHLENKFLERVEKLKNDKRELFKRERKEKKE